MRIQWEKTTLYQETSSVNTLTQRASFLPTQKLALLFFSCALLLAPLHYERDLCKQPAMQMMASRHREYDVHVHAAPRSRGKSTFLTPTAVCFLHLMTMRAECIREVGQIVAAYCCKFLALRSDKAPLGSGNQALFSQLTCKLFAQFPICVRLKNSLCRRLCKDSCPHGTLTIEFFMTEEA
jgi:hypothetical protein